MAPCTLDFSRALPSKLLVISKNCDWSELLLRHWFSDSHLKTTQFLNTTLSSVCRFTDSNPSIAEPSKPLVVFKTIGTLSKVIKVCRNSPTYHNI